MLLTVGEDVRPRCSICGKPYAIVSKLLGKVGLGENGVIEFYC
jgi:hypothetical protein